MHECMAYVCSTHTCGGGFTFYDEEGQCKGTDCHYVCMGRDGVNGAYCDSD